MRDPIPAEKTKAYWDRRVPFPYQQKKVLLIDIVEAILSGILVGSIYFFLGFEIDYRINAVIMMSICYLLVIVFFLRTYLFSKIDKSTGDTRTKEMYFIGFGKSESLDSIRFLYPKELSVHRVQLYYRVDGKFQIGPRYLRCVITDEKWDEMVDLFWEWNNSPSKKRYWGDILINFILHSFIGTYDAEDSANFKVTYTRFNKELLKIELAEGETYPESEEYKELLERVNIMF